MFRLLCKLGIHRPLTNHEFRFIDRVSGKSVYIAECPCGKKWLTDSLSKWFGFRVLRDQEKHR